MKISDTLSGILVLVLGAGLWWSARALPNPANQVYGPAAFPSLVAALLAGAGLSLLWSGWRSRPRAQAVELAGWTREPWTVLRFLLVPFGVFLFIVLVEPVGFIPVTCLLLYALLAAGGVGVVRSVLLALAGTMLVHAVFYLVLKVQLPWGLLEPIRW